MPDGYVTIIKDEIQLASAAIGADGNAVLEVWNLAPATSRPIVQMVTTTPTNFRLSLRAPTTGGRDADVARRVFGRVDDEHPPAQWTTTLIVATARTTFRLPPGVASGTEAGETFWLHYWLTGRGDKHPEGHVTVFEGDTTIATVQIVDGVVSIPLQLDAGTHDRRLAYAGDVNFEPAETTVRGRFGANRRRAVR